MLQESYCYLENCCEYNKAFAKIKLCYQKNVNKYAMDKQKSSRYVSKRH